MRSAGLRFLLSTVGLFLVLTAACTTQAPAPSSSEPMKKEGDTMMEKKDGAMMDKLPDLIRAAHFVDSSPKHGDTLVQTPERVLVNFDFTLNEISTISVTKDGASVEAGKLALGSNKLSMTVSLPSMAGNGQYVVKYKACWPDRSCHDGLFAFVVDDKMKTSYQDMRDKSEVLVSMRDLKFQPSFLIISKGTRVVWKNQEAIPHFINSDPHPSHNVLPALNSLNINEGKEYSYTFAEAGEWPYHCSAHYPEGMAGRILVL